MTNSVYDRICNSMKSNEIILNKMRKLHLDYQIRPMKEDIIISLFKDWNSIEDIFKEYRIPAFLDDYYIEVEFDLIFNEIERDLDTIILYLEYMSKENSDMIGFHINPSDYPNNTPTRQLVCEKIIHDFMHVHSVDVIEENEILTSGNLAVAMEYLKQLHDPAMIEYAKSRSGSVNHNGVSMSLRTYLSNFCK